MDGGTLADFHKGENVDQKDIIVVCLSLYELRLNFLTKLKIKQRVGSINE